MKYAFLFIMSAMILFQTSNDAEARRGTTKTHELFFYADTTIPTPDDTVLSLCYLTQTDSKFFLNFWRSIDSYVLSSQKCEGNTYLSITPEQFAQAKKDDLISAETPDEPSMGIGMRLGGTYGSIIIGILLLGALGKKIKARKNSST